MNTVDSLIINVPVFLSLFLALSTLTLLWIFRSRMPAVIGLGILTWQALAGAVLLTVDYRKRKIALFYRIIDSCSNETKLNLLTKPLRGTLCGEMMRLAIKNRFRKRSDNSILELTEEDNEGKI